jgi:hypothetical protein
MPLCIAPCAFADDSGRPRHEEAASIPLSSNASSDPHLTGQQGILAKPIRIEGTGISLSLGGWVQADFIQDFEPVGNESQFKVNSIPVSGNPDAELGGNTNFQIKQTRLILDARSAGEAGDIRAYIEGDFFGGGDSFRIRHAYGEWKGIMAGQNWSTFQDISARPHTLDYEGPDAEVFVRQVQLRYTHKVSDTLEWAAALEEPDSQITSAGSGSGRSELPDLAANLRFTGSRGHVQLGGLLRQLRFEDGGGAIDATETGWGVNLSGGVTVMDTDGLMGSVALGSGVGRYIESFGGQGSDAVLTAGNKLEALDAVAFVGGYEHAWNSQFKSTVSAAYAEVDNVDSQPGSAIKSATSFHANLMYKPNRLIMIGGELMWGEREDFDGSTGDATRLQVSIQYKLK